MALLLRHQPGRWCPPRRPPPPTHEAQHAATGTNGLAWASKRGRETQARLPLPVKPPAAGLALCACGGCSNAPLTRSRSRPPTFFFFFFFLPRSRSKVSSSLSTARHKRRRRGSTSVAKGAEGGRALHAWPQRAPLSHLRDPQLPPQADPRPAAQAGRQSSGQPHCHTWGTCFFGRDWGKVRTHSHGGGVYARVLVWASSSREA